MNFEANSEATPVSRKPQTNWANSNLDMWFFLGCFHVGQAGTVHSASVVEDRDTGRSRGFAFVEMSSEQEATSAIEQFNGKELGGRALKVNEAKPRENRGGGGRGFGDNRGGGYGGNGGGRPEPRW